MMVRMPRVARNAPGGLVYHVLNRANGRQVLFRTEADYLAFEAVLAEACRRTNGAVELLGWCLMPNHFHLLLRPRGDRDLSAFMGWLTLTHAQRWKQAHRAVGHGHLYQGRFKSFPVQDDQHFLVVLRYIERNPLRVGIVDRAERWRWSSLHARRTSGAPLREFLVLAPPVELPRRWLALVNEPQTAAEELAVRLSIARWRPFGDTRWTATTAARLNLTWTLRPRGRPVGWRKGTTKTK